MITLYDRYETAFNTNGLGILEVYDDVVEEELNGIFKLTFKYPKFARLGSSIANGMTLRANVPGGQEPFRIWSLVDRDDVLEVTAHHISFDLYFKFIEDKNLVTLGSQAALVRLLEDTPFTGLSDVVKTDSVRVVRKSVQQAIFSDDDNSFLTRWGGEFKRTGFTLNAMNRRGRAYAQNPVSIRYGKDLVSYEATEDESTYYNRVMPIGFDGLLLPEKYVDRPGIDLNDIRITTVEYSDIKPIEDPENPREDEVPLATAYQMMRDRVAGEFEAGVYDAKANYRVEFVDLSSTVEHANKAVLVTRYLGDEVKVVRSTDSIMARVISYRYSPTLKEYLSVELGNFQEKPMNIVSQVDLLNRMIVEVSERQLTVDYVTNLLTSALGGYVKQINGEMFIMDTEDPMTATKVWRWNLNGLGYSATGINGPYETAITMDGTIVGEFLEVRRIYADNIVNSMDGSRTLYVASTSTGDGSGQDAANKANSVYTALTIGLDGAKYLKDGSVITVVIEGAITEDVYIGGFIGSGTLILDGGGTAEFKGQIYVENCTVEVIFQNMKIYKMDTSPTSALFTAENSTNLYVKNCTIIGNTYGYCFLAWRNGGIHSQQNDIVDFTQTYRAWTNSIVSNDRDTGSRAGLNGYVAYAGYGGRVALALTRPLSGTPGSVSGTASGGSVDVTDAVGTESVNSPTVPPPSPDWTTQTKTFYFTRKRENVTENNWFTSGEFAQGKSNSGTTYRGHGYLYGAIKSWLEGSGGYQVGVTMRMRAKRGSLWGLDSNPVGLKFTSPYSITTGEVIRGAVTPWVTLSTSAANSIAAGNDHFSTSTTLTSDYASWDWIQIEVTASKK